MAQWQAKAEAFDFYLVERKWGANSSEVDICPFKTYLDAKHYFEQSIFYMETKTLFGCCWAKPNEGSSSPITKKMLSYDQPPWRANQAVIVHPLVKDEHCHLSAVD